MFLVYWNWLSNKAMNEKHKRVKTPCIGVCSTGIGDSVCRGCKRFNHEVIHWNSYTDGEKKAVLNRLQLLLAQVVSDKIQVYDVDKLTDEIKRQQVRVNDHSDPHCWVFDLLKAGATQISDLNTFGCRLRPAWQNSSLIDIRDLIDAHFFELSSAHYQRYFFTPL